MKRFDIIKPVENHPDHICCTECWQRGINWGSAGEREEIVEGLRMVADAVLKPSDYRDGYIQAMNDIRDDDLPNAPRFIQGEN